MCCFILQQDLSFLIHIVDSANNLETKLEMEVAYANINSSFIAACFVVPGNLRVLQLSSFRAMQHACVKEYIPAKIMNSF